MSATDALFNTQSRECWLLALVERARPLFEAAGSPLPATVRVGIGQMSTARGNRIGECYSDAASDDGAREIWIKPYTRDAIEIVGTLVHELCHAALPFGVGHKAEFVRLARKMHLEGKATATTIGKPFRDVWEPIVDSVGAYPGGIVRASRSSRSTGTPAQVKIECDCCSIKLWLTPKMRDTIGSTMQCVNVECGGQLHDA